MIKRILFFAVVLSAWSIYAQTSTPPLTGKGVSGNAGGNTADATNAVTVSDVTVSISHTDTVLVTNYVFTPKDLTITAGDTVVWVDIGYHNVDGKQSTFPNNPESFGNSEGSGWTYIHVFNNPGLYNYQCDVHAALGMTGTVTVLNPLALANIEGTALSYTEGDPATAITSTIAVSDADNSTLASGTIIITSGLSSSQDVLSFTNSGSSMGNITASYNAATGVLTMTSSGATATLAQWQSALRAVNYRNTSQDPSTSTRTVSFTVNDGSSNSNTVTRNITITAATGVVDELSGLIADFNLEQNYPNPFNPTTKIKYSISQTAFVTLKIYNTLGKEVATLVNDEKTAGYYEVNFNAASLPSGVYFYKLEAGNFIQTKKMILMK